MLTVKILVVTDAYFANARGIRGQLGFAVFIVEAKGLANIIHYGSAKCKRVTRSVTASELHTLIIVFGEVFVIRDAVFEILGLWASAD